MKIGGDFIDMSKTLKYTMRFWILFGLLLAFCNGINGEESGKCRSKIEFNYMMNWTLFLILELKIELAVSFVCESLTYYSDSWYECMSPHFDLHSGTKINFLPA